MMEAHDAFMTRLSDLVFVLITDPGSGLLHDDVLSVGQSRDFLRLNNNEEKKKKQQCTSAH